MAHAQPVTTLPLWLHVIVKRLLILVLLLAGTAQADHHRNHAIAKLDSAENYLRQGLEQGDIVFSCPDFTEFQQARANNFHTYLDRAFEDIYEARELLATGGDLTTIRRLISQPHKKASKDGGQPSALQWVAGQVRNMRFFFGVCPENSAALSTMQQKLTLGWQFLDTAEWHIVDAILDEQRKTSRK